MKTLCIQLNYDSHDETLPLIGNSDFIRVCSCWGKDESIFKICVRAVTVMQLVVLEGAPSMVTMSYAKKSYSSFQGESEVAQDLKIILEPCSDYIVNIHGVLSGKLYFDDITQISTFDATTCVGVENEWCGLLVDAADLIKLSSVEFLGLRYSLLHAHKLNGYELEYFGNLKELYLGTETHSFNISSIHISDTTMRCLRTLNIGVNILPWNIVLLSDCTSLYIDCDALWGNLNGIEDVLYEECSKISYVKIQSTHREYADTIIKFYRKKIMPTQVACTAVLPIFLADEAYNDMIEETSNVHVEYK